ncbi:MAG: Amuc_1100 family pilus-like protein [Verrucomicrobiota bacterium]
MNWIKENKFLAGTLGVVLVVGGVLTYFLIVAMGDADEARTGYATDIGTLQRLAGASISPTGKNSQALDLQLKEAKGAVEAFQAKLAANAFPLVPMKPEAFQDKLKATKSAAIERAAQGQTELPAKFFLGFDAPTNYEGSLPSPLAAPALGRELESINWVLTQLLDSHITKLESLKREPLPEETPGKVTEKTLKKGGGAVMPLVSTHSFELKFECRHNSLATFLNALVGPKAPQFYTPRVIQIKNQKDRVPKADASILGSAIPPPPPIVEPGGAPKGLAPAAPIKAVAAYIVGEEQLEVTLSIGVVNFAPPPSAVAEK